MYADHYNDLQRMMRQMDEIQLKRMHAQNANHWALWTPDRIIEHYRYELESGGRPRRSRRAAAKDAGARGGEGCSADEAGMDGEAGSEVGGGCLKGTRRIAGRSCMRRMFAGKKVHVDSPQGRFTDAGLLDGRVLQGVMAVGKHLGYDFGTIAESDESCMCTWVCMATSSKVGSRCRSRVGRCG